MTGNGTWESEPVFKGSAGVCKPYKANKKINCLQRGITGLLVDTRAQMVEVKAKLNGPMLLRA